MSPLNGNVGITIGLTLTKSLDLSTPQDNLSKSNKLTLSDTAGALYPADQLFHDVRTLADGANETLDLTASLTDAFGATVSFSNLKAIFIQNNSADANLLVGGAAANPLDLFAASANDILKIPRKGIFYMQYEHADGFIVSTSDQLKIEHDGSGSDALTYDIILVGNTAQPTPTPTPTATPTPSPSPTPTPTPT